MKQFLSTLLLHLGFFSLPLFCQTSHFPTPEARRDSTLAYGLLLQAQHHLDTLQMEAALAKTLEAERILRGYLDENAAQMTDVYCLQGLALPRSERPATLALGEKVQQLPPSPNPATRANALYFLATCALYKGQVANAEEIYQKALELYLALPDPRHANIGRIYSNLGLMAANQGGRFEEAKALYQKAIDFFTEHFDPNFPILASPYNNRGLVFWGQGLYEEALVDLKTALRIRAQVLPAGHPHIAATLNNLGLVAYEKGALEQAHQYFLQALAMFKQSKDTFLESQTVTNLGMVRERQFEPADARRYYEQTLVIEQAQTPPKNDDIAITLFNIGVSWREEGILDTALQYFQRALQLATPEHPRYAQILSSIGLTLKGMNQYAEALHYFERAYTVQVAQYGEQHPFLTQILFNQANVAMEQGELNRASVLNQKAQQKLGYNGNQNFDKVLLLFDLCAVLAQESHLRFRSAKDTGALQQALSSAQSALLAFQQFSRINRQATERQVAKAAAFATTEVAIGANQSLFQLTKDTNYWHDAFSHAEHSKATLLLEAMQEAKTLKNSNANPGLLKQERQIREDLAKSDIRLQEGLVANVSPTDSALVQIALDRAKLLVEYDTLVLQIAEAGDSRLSLRTLGVKTIQEQLLQPGQTLLEYFVGDSSIFLFLVQKDYFEVQEVKKDFPLEQWVDTLTRLGIYGFHTLPLEKRVADMETETVNNYTQAALRLYEKLIAPVKAKFTDELIIIPDGVLGYIPFEALLTKAPGRKGNFTSYAFLLNEHRISYCYSATLLQEMREKQHNISPKKSALALAPFFRGDVKTLNAQDEIPDVLAVTNTLRDSLKALKASGSEVKFVSGLWNGAALYGTAATLDTFRQLAGQYRILHLSTHGKADDRVGDYAYLALGASGSQKDYEKLYARDIYNLELNADLVVLSACETGLGKFRRGEGIIGLSRAFAYAGAKSLVTSLWKVDDSKTKELLVEFYKQLKAGKPKDKALQQAKLDFLAQNRKNGGALMHPFFWAGFIAIGDMAPVR